MNVIEQPNKQPTPQQVNSGQRKTVAVIVVSYHTGPVLMTALESVLVQPELTELVLVNNGNPAEVVDALTELVDREPRLTLLDGQGNIGFAAGCNLGVASCSSELLMMLNPDCVLPGNALGSLLNEYEQLPALSLLSPLLINPDFTEQRGSRRTVLTPWRALVEWLGLYRLAPAHPYFRRFNQSTSPLPMTTHAVEVTSGAAMLLSRKLFRELSGFDERYFLHVEDIDLCVSLLKRGGSAYVAPQIRVVHYVSSSRSPAARVEWHKALGFCRYFKKHFVGLYPAGFVGGVGTLVILRYVARLPLLLFRRTGSSDTASFVQQQINVHDANTP